MRRWRDKLTFTPVQKKDPAEISTSNGRDVAPCNNYTKKRGWDTVTANGHDADPAQVALLPPTDSTTTTTTTVAIISPPETCVKNGGMNGGTLGTVALMQPSVIANGNGDVSSQQPPQSPPPDSSDELCGIGGCTPTWLQPAASKQSFLAVFCITCVLQGMFYTYFVSVITTIEKLFQIQSKTTGIIMSATEIGQISSSLLLTYYGGQGHRPRWIGSGMVMFAISALICSLPHFFYGKDLAPNRAYTPALPDGVHVDNFTGADQVCFAVDSAPVALFLRNMTSLSYTWEEGLELKRVAECLEAEESTQSVLKTTTFVLSVFFMSLLGVGMGQTAVYTLGIPYIDDNVANRESPVYFAITIGVRILGPVLGFVLGSLCTSLYVDLSNDSGLSPRDPRWIGAWWLGLVIVSSLLFVVSFAMFSFPRRLPNKNAKLHHLQALAREPNKRPSLRDFPKAVKRLLKNQVLMLRTVSSVLHILPIAGLYTFLPKYLESQFRLTAHTANMIAGIGGILVMGVGILGSGVFIRKVKPNARFVAAWIAFTALIYSIGMASLMFVGCDLTDFAGLTISPEGVKSVDPVRNTSCICDQTRFSPICGSDNMTYYSACHAGCHNISEPDPDADHHMQLFSNCECISEGGSTAEFGFCPLACNNLVTYLLLFSVFVLVHSTSEVGSMLLILRCVDPRDKAMALGLIQFAIGLFGNVPCPIIYGAVVDSACLVWEKTCHDLGACRLYDSGTFRTFFHGMTASVMFLAFLMDITVWYKAGSISFADDDTPPTKTEEVPSDLQLQYETSI